MRVFCFDFIRAIAIFLVICIHSMGNVNLGVETGDSDAKIVNSFMGFIYSGVPLFVMLSGSLLIGKEEKITIFFKKRITRMLLPFVFWSIVVGSILYIQNGGRNVEGGMSFVLNGLFTSGVHSIYWYVYMILGLYLITPVLRIIAKNDTGGGGIMLYLSGLLLIITLSKDVFPQVSLFSRWSCENITMLFYYIAGYLITTKTESCRRGKYLVAISRVLLPLLCIVMVISRYLEIKIIGMTIWFSLTFFICLVTLPLASFESINILRSVIVRISRYSYGIYLSHFMLISIIIKSGVPSKVPLTVEPFLMAITILTLEVLLMWVLEWFRLGKYVM